MEVHKNNPCAGAYGKSMDIKMTDECNGRCEFCIEKHGFKSKIRVDPRTLADAVNKGEYDSVLVLGGEPLLYEELPYFLSLLKTKPFITTNGSLLSLSLAKQIAPYLKGINVSWHHYTKNKEITGVELHPEIASAIAYLKVMGVGTRINCNLVKGYIDNFIDASKMLIKAMELGATSIRFAELQHAPEQYVDATTIFANLPTNPFTEGCDVLYKHTDGFDVWVRLTCGLLNPTRPKVENPTGRKASTDVLYPDGVVSHWGREKVPIKDYDISSDTGEICHRIGVACKDEADDCFPNAKPTGCHSSVNVVQASPCSPSPSPDECHPIRITQPDECHPPRKSTPDVCHGSSSSSSTSTCH